MCLSDAIKALQEEFSERITSAKIHFAIKNGKVARPALNGALRFEFSAENIAELRSYFERRQEKHHAKALAH